MDGRTEAHNILKWQPSTLEKSLNIENKISIISLLTLTVPGGFDNQHHAHQTCKDRQGQMDELQHQLSYPMVAPRQSGSHGGGAGGRQGTLAIHSFSILRVMVSLLLCH